MEIVDVRIAVAKQLGFPEDAGRVPAILSQEDNIKLLDYTFAYIARNPDKFTSSQVAIAKRHLDAWGTETPIEDTSFNWSLFGDEVENNIVKAGESIAGIGEGILNTAKLAKYAIPALALGVAVYFLWKKFGNK